MEEQEIKQKCLKLMETADAVYLSTIDENDFPQTRAMVNLRNKQQFQDIAKMFAGHEEDFLVYMTTDTASGKFKQIQANPKASVYFCDPKEIKGLLLIGEVEVVTDRDIKHRLWHDDWKIYYPSGPDGPEYNILALRPKQARCWFVPMPAPFEFKLK
jgi:general stress protein 26